MMTLLRQFCLMLALFATTASAVHATPTGMLTGVVAGDGLAVPCDACDAPTMEMAGMTGACEAACFSPVALARGMAVGELAPIFVQGNLFPSVRRAWGMNPAPDPFPPRSIA